MVKRFLLRRLGACLALLFLLTFKAMGAENQIMDEYTIKSAYLFNFIKFVEWPSDTFNTTDNIFLIGILGDDPFNSNLEGFLTSKSVKNKNIVIRHVSTLDEAKTCQLLFISSSEQNRLPGILQALQTSSVFTVGEMDQFVQRGGMLGFKMIDNHVRFEINLAAAKKAKLEISSQLLKLATHIISDVPSENK